MTKIHFAAITTAILWPLSSAHISHAERGVGEWPIKNGYVAFGDSFAAGIGTGTSTDSCRAASNNFGALLNQWKNKDINYQPKMCSGDTIVGLNRQIDEWSDPKATDLATVSMGGNELEFSELIKNCLLNPYSKPRSTIDAACTQFKGAARSMISDGGTGGLQAKLQAAYKRILEKSTREDFHLYATTYPLFFNDVDEDCDKTIFNYWWAGYNPSWETRNIYLTIDLRKEMNGLVSQLNTVIGAAVQIVNDERGRNQVHLVDVNPWFDKEHHWCEAGGFHEPDEGRRETWFFLSGWSDVDIFDPSITEVQQVAIKAQEATLIGEYVSAGEIVLPDAVSCQDQLGTDPDPWAVTLCEISQDINANPNGAWAANHAAANEEVAAGNFSGQHVPWYLPTRQIKTFHPRSPGMVGYRDAIIASVLLHQAGAAPSSKEDTCSIDVRELWTCEDSASNLYAEVTISAPDGSELYSTGQSTTSPGQPINDPHPLTLDTDYGSITLVGEHVNDYIQFTSGDHSWNSGTTEGDATCKLMGDDWKGPPSCNAMLSREFECKYPCSKSAGSRRKGKRTLHYVA